MATASASMAHLALWSLWLGNLFFQHGADEARLGESVSRGDGGKGLPLGSVAHHTPGLAKLINLAAETTKICIQFELTVGENSDQPALMKYSTSERSLT